MWKKYKEFLRKRTDRQLLVGDIIAMLIMLPIILLGVKNICLVFNNIPESIIVIIVIVIVLIYYIVMITCYVELARRDAEERKELEREAHKRLREKLKEEARKELEQEKK